MWWSLMDFGTEIIILIQLKLNFSTGNFLLQSFWEGGKNC